MEIAYGRARTKKDLEEILELQSRNLFVNVSRNERKTEGFVTVSHTAELLQKMNEACAHIVAKAGGKVIGYALCMHPDFADDIELLRPMFLKIRQLVPENENYMVMGQVCIDQAFRKKGVFRKLYETMKKETREEFDCIITEVDIENQRSLQAHYSVGFKVLTTYRSKDRQWCLIYWK